MKQISKKFIKFLKKNFESDFIKDSDIESYYNRGISESENEEIFMEKYCDFLKSRVRERLLLQQNKSDIERVKAEEEQRIKEEEKKLIENWKKTKPQDITINSFKIPKIFVEMVCKRISYGTILISRGGLGKSFLTINEVKKSKRDFVYYSGFITPLELYKTLFRNNGKVLIFDDVQGIFDNIKSISLLKSCLWEVNSKRMVNMETSSAKKEEVPCMFEFTGNIIILGNKLNISNVNLNAIKDRTNYYELNFTYQEIINIMKKICHQPYKNLTLEQRKKALNLIKKNTNITTENLSLRLLIKAYQYFEYNEKKAEELLKSIIKNDDDLTLIKELMENGLKVNEQISQFIEKTGKSRRTFYNKKKELLCKSAIK